MATKEEWCVVIAGTFGFVNARLWTYSILCNIFPFLLFSFLSFYLLYYRYHLVGFCSSLAFQPPDELARTLEITSKARITIVSLPMVNQWTQDRDHSGGRTPKWRGITLLHEAHAAGIPVSIASDNTRDQFYAYGDLDMLEVFTQGCRMAHLDRPYGDWIRSVTTTPANAMHLKNHGRIGPGIPANFVIFKARRYSELLSRPHMDRCVVRDGRVIDAVPPDYGELEYVPESIRSGQVPVAEVEAYGPEGITSTTRLGAPFDASKFSSS